jgi:(1->4)-alpha-D-glucan 1-alpha-D-glucosylmutase
VLSDLQGLFVYQPHKKIFNQIYAAFTDQVIKPSELIFQSKQEVLLGALSSELHVLSRCLDRISQQHRSSRDFTTEGLKAALRDTIASFPVYRSYIDAACEKIEDEDRQHIVTAIQRAKRVNPATSASIFDFLQSVLLLKYPPGITEEQKKARYDFVMRFQQLTSPVMAKGVEDTAFYRYYPLACLNEVGGDLYGFGISEDTFHEKNAERCQNWPYSLSTTSTHDTKRSEDVRMRLATLSEIPNEWQHALFRWSCMNEEHKAKEQEESIPDSNEEYLLYQTLIGTWPDAQMDKSTRRTYMERIQAYMEKALKEAKCHTSWINPNPEYDQKVCQFIEKILKDGDNPFLDDFDVFVKRCTRCGMLNSLNQTLLKITTPGTPDIYQGNDLFDFSLVDPDNRRQVSYSERKMLVEALNQEKRGSDFFITCSITHQMVK